MVSSSVPTLIVFLTSEDSPSISRGLDSWPNNLLDEGLWVISGGYIPSGGLRVCEDPEQNPIFFFIEEQTLTTILGCLPSKHLIYRR